MRAQKALDVDVCLVLNPGHVNALLYQTTLQTAGQLVCVCNRLTPHIPLQITAECNGH
jgi:hypothetical protein